MRQENSYDANTNSSLTTSTSATGSTKTIWVFRLLPSVSPNVAFLLSLRNPPVLPSLLMRAESVSRMVRLVDGSLPKDVNFSIKKNKKNPPFIRESTLQPSFNDLLQNVGDLLLPLCMVVSPHLTPKQLVVFSPMYLVNPRFL